MLPNEFDFKIPKYKNRYAKLHAKVINKNEILIQYKMIGRGKGETTYNLKTVENFLKHNTWVIINLNVNKRF